MASVAERRVPPDLVARGTYEAMERDGKTFELNGVRVELVDPPVEGGQADPDQTSFILGHLVKGKLDAGYQWPDAVQPLRAKVALRAARDDLKDGRDERAAPRVERANPFGPDPIGKAGPENHDPGKKDK